MLAVENIGKDFAGVKALNEVSLELCGGMVTAIIGENGAGKSTLMKILSGVYQYYSGSIYFNGERVSFKNTKEAQDQGICIIHQELNLIPHLSIRENIFLGREYITAMGFLNIYKMRKECLELLRRLKLNLDPETPVYRLKVGQQQLVEIAKALSLDSQVIIMDEPTSAISDAEVEVLFEIISDLKQKGKAIAFISHKLNELFTIAERYVVLRDGEMVETGNMRDVTEDHLIEKMVGREIDVHRNQFKKSFDKKVLTVDNLLVRNPRIPDKLILQNISFQLGKGEILGVFGLMGAGRTELMETLFGLREHSGGKICIDNQACNFKSPMEAMKAGLAFVPEDRKHDGLILQMDICNNLSLTVVDKILSMGFLDSKKEESLTEKYVKELKIKTSSLNQRVEKLSGGNQQKVVLAKWLATHPKALLLDEPTRGIDINAKNEIYKLIKQLASDGLGLIMVSSELSEILAVCDRVMTIAEGKMTGLITIDEKTSEDEILKAAIPESGNKIK